MWPFDRNYLKQAYKICRHIDAVRYNNLTFVIEEAKEFGQENILSFSALLLDLDIQVAADLAKKINMLFGTACVDDYDYCINNFENYTNRELAILTIASHFTKVGKSNIERIRTEVLHKAIFELVPEKTQAPISPREGVFRDFKCN